MERSLTLKQIKNIIKRLPEKETEKDCNAWGCTTVHHEKVLPMSRQDLIEMFVNKTEKLSPFLSVGSTAVIPKGYYCYDNKGDCPYYRIVKKRPKRLNGFCDYLRKGDVELCKERIKHNWTIKRKKGKERSMNLREKKELALSGGMSLLWDKCKECRINVRTNKEMKEQVATITRFVTKYEKTFGSVRLLKACVSAINKLLVEKKIVSKEELTSELSNVMGGLEGLLESNRRYADNMLEEYKQSLYRQKEKLRKRK